MLKIAFETYLSAITPENADKEYWYEQFQRLRPLFQSVPKMASTIGEFDPQFKTVEGVNKLYSVNARTASRQLAQQAVYAILAYIDATPAAKKLYKALPAHNKQTLPCS